MGYRDSNTEPFGEAPSGVPGSQWNPRDAPMVGRVLAGGLRVLHRLGSTPEGPVHQGQYPNGVGVAVLLLSPDSTEGASGSRARFDQATRIQHPNVAAVYTVGELEDRSVYAVLEQVSGEPLSDAIAAGRAFSLGEAVAIIGQVAAGLQAVYRGGFVHGNLSPHAILLAPAADGAPRIKLTGFTPHPALSPNAAPVAVPRGTVAIYASPERLSGKQPDQRSEIFSLGALLHHLLVGLPPDQGVVAGAVPRPARALLVRALAATPDQRFQTLPEFEAALAGIGPAAGAKRVVSRGGPVKRVVLAGLALAVAGVLLLLAWQRGALPMTGRAVVTEVKTPAPPATAAATSAPAASRPRSGEPDRSVATKVAARFARSKAALVEMAQRLSRREMAAPATGAPRPPVPSAEPPGRPRSEQRARSAPRRAPPAAGGREVKGPAPEGPAPQEALGYASGPTPAADSLPPPKVSRPPQVRRSGAPSSPTVAQPRSRAELELDQSLRESIRDVVRLGIVEDVVEVRPGSLRVSLSPNAMQEPSAEYNLQRLYLAYSAASRYLYGVELDLWRGGERYGRFTREGLESRPEPDARGVVP